MIGVSLANVPNPKNVQARVNRRATVDQAAPARAKATTASYLAIAVFPSNKSPAMIIRAGSSHDLPRRWEAAAVRNMAATQNADISAAKK
jgi:hypothetical protein